VNETCSYLPSSSPGIPPLSSIISSSSECCCAPQALPTPPANRHPTPLPNLLWCSVLQPRCWPCAPRTCFSRSCASTALCQLLLILLQRCAHIRHVQVLFSWSS
jgi:hypothetical protein